MIDAKKLASDISHKVRGELAGKNVAFDVEWPNPEEMSLSLSMEGQDIVEREIRKALESAVGRADRNELDARRYRFLRTRDLDLIEKGGIFAGSVPENIVVNGEDLDMRIDAAIEQARQVTGDV